MMAGRSSGADQAPVAAPARTVWLDRFLPPEAHADHARIRPARLVIGLAFGAALANGFFSVFFAAVMRKWPPALILAGAAIVALSIPWVLRRTSTNFAGNALALVAFLSLGATCFVRGGLIFPVFVWNLVIPLAAAIMGRSRTVLVWTVLIIGQGAVLLSLGAPVTPTRYGILSMVGLLGVVVVAGMVLDQRERQLVDGQRLLREELLNRQRLESIGLLAAGVAHDLNNVLSIIRTQATLGIDECEHDPVREDFRTIVDATDRGAKLTRSLLGFGKTHALASSSPAPSTDTSESIASLSKVFEVVLTSGLDVEFQLEDELPLIDMRPQHFEHVLVNLVINAGDAMPEGGSIRVSTCHMVIADPAAIDVDVQGGEYVVIGVSDTGRGIAPERLQTIFEPFYTTKENGTGIGLASVRATVTGCGGGIHVSSTLGAGTDFKVFLPVRKSAGGGRLSGTMRRWRASGTRRRSSSNPGKEVGSVG